MTDSIPPCQHHQKKPVAREVSGTAVKNCQQEKAQNTEFLFKLAKLNQRNPKTDNLRQTQIKQNFQLFSHKANQI